MNQMFKQTISYTDFNGTERTEDLYFHLSKVEMLRLQTEIGGDLQEYAKRVTQEGNLEELLAFIEKMILNSYGKKTLDGRSFTKSKELREEFENSQAYAEVFELLLTTPGLAEKFGQGIVETGAAKKNTVAPTVVEA